MIPIDFVEFMARRKLRPNPATTQKRNATSRDWSSLPAKAIHG